MQEVSDATGVKSSKIYRWLKQERLEVSEGSPVALNFEKCGIRIRSGRFCVECSKILAKEMDAGKKRTAAAPAERRFIRRQGRIRVILQA